MELTHIVILINDIDFTSTFEYIASVLIHSYNRETFSGKSILANISDIERFIKSLIPTAIEFAQYRVNDIDDFWYRNITKSELDRLTDYLKFKIYPNLEIVEDFDYGGEGYVIDFVNKTFKRYEDCLTKS